jgi:hypothetical protein
VPGLQIQRKSIAAVLLNHLFQTIIGIIVIEPIDNERIFGCGVIPEQGY